MAQHGYLHDRYDRGGFDDDRQRGHDDRNFMFDRGERDWGGRDEDRGFFSRMGEGARSWFRDDDDEGRRQRGRSQSSDEDEWFGGRSRSERGMSHYGREHGFGGFQGDYGRSGREQGGFGGRGDWEQRRRSFSAHPDDHYRSWRDRQMEALDREYEDYCREREQQFHQDFESWRRNRRQQGAGEQEGGSSDQVLELGASDSRAGATAGSSNATDAATLGTNNSENSATGRGRR